jgi:hypothetical protein
MTENVEVFGATEAGLVQSFQAEDLETMAVVEAQMKVEKTASLALKILCAIPVIGSLVKDGVLSAVISVVIMFFVHAGLVWLLRVLVFSPMRSARFAPCVRRMNDLAKSRMDLVKWSSWKTPLPQFLAIDPGRRSLFIESPDTGYRALVLSPEQIAEVKVEREQVVETKTSHGSRMTYSFGSTGLGMVGGGSSRSTSKVIETAFLEISYVLNSASTPTRVVLAFGTDRRGADDWVIAIRHMCGTAR